MRSGQEWSNADSCTRVDAVCTNDCAAGDVIACDLTASPNKMTLKQKYLNRDATSEETGPAEERVVIIVGPERVIPFPSSSEEREP